MSPLLVSLLALAMGPLLIALAGRRPWAHAAIDGFVVVAIGGLVLLDILPEAIQAAGWPALAAAAGGLVVPALWHGPHDDCTPRSAQPLLAAASVAMGLHAFVDGVALVLPAGGDPALAWAVALHRLPEGMAMAWMLLPHAGRRGVALGLAWVAACTGAGFAVGDVAYAHGLGGPILLVQAAVAGSLLHVLLRHAPGDRAAAPPIASGVAGLAAAVLLARLAGGHQGSAHGAGGIGALVADLAVPILWGLASGAVGAALAAVWSPRLLNARPREISLWAALRGALTGVLLGQGCRGAPDALAARAMRQAAPALGPVAAGLTWALLGWPVLMLRALAATLIGAVAAMSETREAGRRRDRGAFRGTAGATVRAGDGDATSHPLPSGPGPAADAVDAVAATIARSDVAATVAASLDIALPWLGAGLILATAIVQGLPASWPATLAASGAEIPVLALLGLPLFIGAPATTLVGAALAARGVSIGGVVALVVAAWAASPRRMAALARAQGAATALRVALVGLSVAVAAGLVAARLAPRAVAVGAVAPPAVAALAALAAMSLLRQGVRPFLAHLLAPNTLGPPGARGEAGHHAHGASHVHRGPDAAPLAKTPPRPDRAP